MEVNEEFKHKMKRRSVEIMKKAKRLAELAGEETVSLDFLQSSSNYSLRTKKLLPWH